MTDKPHLPNSEGKIPLAGQRPNPRWAVMGVVVFALGAALAFLAGQFMLDEPLAEPRQGQGAAVERPDVTPIPADAPNFDNVPKTSAQAAAVIDDDGRSMWTSPTSGKPLTWVYLPPGVQMVLSLRPAAISSHLEGEKVLSALGPLGAAGIRAIEQQTGLAWRQIERLVVGWQLVGDEGALAATLVVYPVPEAVSTWPDGAPPEAVRSEHAGQSYWKMGDRAYYRPGREKGPALVVAPLDAMGEIIELGGEPPPIRRDVGRLLAQTDADRHATLVVVPGVLFGEGREMFAGELASLRGPLFWLMGDIFSAAALSLHWDDNFFLEAIATPTLDLPSNRAAEQLADRIVQMPDLIETYVVGLNTSAYGRRVVARLPGMVRKLAGYARSGFDRDHVVVRCYLPAIAGHNLLMGAELALSEEVGDLAGRPAAKAASPVAGDSIREVLKRSISLRIPRDTLEAVLAELGKVLGVEIVILGADLQADGVTKNQMLAVDFAERPAEEILVEILRQANPDKSAAGASDPRQKVVYVIGPPSPGKPEAVLITTRPRAAVRGQTLPDAFEPGRTRDAGNPPRSGK